MTPENEAAARYFDAIAAALAGLEIFMRDDRSPLYRHGIVAKIVAEYIARLERSFSSWGNRMGFMESFRICRAESGFPVFQNVLELENDRRQAEKRLANIPQPDDAARRDGRLHPAPQGVSGRPAEDDGRAALSGGYQDGETFGPFMLAQTAKVSVNPKTMRPYYVVHWASFDGSANLPMIYMATIEDSSENMVSHLVDDNGKINEKVDIPLPVDGLLNPELATASTTSPRRTPPTRCRR